MEPTGEGRFLPTVVLANSIHAGLNTRLAYARHGLGLGELARL